MSEDSDCLLLTVVSLADTGPLRPRVILCPCIRQLRHHFQLDHRLAAVADRRTYAVVSGITAADDDDVLVLGTDIVTIGEVGTDQALGSCFQEIYSVVDAVGIPTFCIDISGIGGTARQNDCIKLLLQLLCGNILSHIHTGAELHALCFHHIHTALHHGLFQLHIRNAVHQQSAHTVFPLKHGDAMTTLIELQCRCQTGGTGTNNCDTFSGTGLWRICLDVSGFESVFNDRILIFLDSDRIAVQSAGARLFTKRRTYTGGKFRKAVGQEQTICCLIPKALVHHVIPLRTQVIQRASGNHAKDRLACLTERNTAVHAACALLLPFFQRQRRVEFTVRLDSFQRFLPCIFDSLIFEKSS